MFVKGQHYNGSQTNFGKNRIQFIDKQWSQLIAQQYDVYFYSDGKYVANYVAQLAEREMAVLQKKLDFKANTRIQFIVFPKLSELKETNIGLITEQNYNIGGITHIIDSKVLIYYEGEHKKLDKQVKAGIAQCFLNEILYGEELTSQIKNSTLLSLPNWFTQGYVSYLSEDWNAELESRTRDGILSGKFKKFNQLTGEDAVIAGHSLWAYVEEKYGEKATVDIIYLTKISRNLETGIMYVIGVAYKDFIKDWIKFYEDKYKEDDANRDQINPENYTLKKTKKHLVYNQFKISPTKEHAVYVANNDGRAKVYLYDFEKKKSKKIFKQGYKLEEKVDLTYPVLAWHPTGKLFSFITEKKGILWLNMYNLEEKKMESFKLSKVDKVLDYSYSQTGQLIVMSATFMGRSDIFILNVASKSFEQITNDGYDDLHPKFVNQSKDIIFVSNRTNDTLVSENQEQVFLRPENNDVFIYKFSEKTPVLERITNTPNINEINPTQILGKLNFLSDSNGLYNRFYVNIDSTISSIDTAINYNRNISTYAATNVKRNILQQDVNARAKQVGETYFYNGKYVLLNKNVGEINKKPIVLTNTSSKDNFLKKISRKINIPKIITKDNIEDTLNVKVKTKSKKRRFGNVFAIDTTNTYKTNDTLQNKNFGDNKQGTKYITNNDSSLTNSNETDQYDKKFFQTSYEVEFSLNQVVTQVDFSYLNSFYQPFTGGYSPIYINSGVNALFKLGAIDLMEDYRIVGGANLNFNLKNNEYIISFENLKKRLDKQIVFHRQPIETTDGYYYYKVQSHQGLYIVKYPFDQVRSLRGNVSLRNVNIAVLSTDAISLKAKNLNEYWAGAKLEYVFDNTVNVDLNLYNGTRYKVYIEYLKQIDKQNTDLYVTGLDFRHYQKIHRTFIWASRFTAGTSFGSRKLIFYLGGVDNWLFPKFNQNVNVDRTINWAYQTLANNMRGFNQNIRNGNSFAVFNTELRFPVFRYFSNKPLRTSFINHFQIIGFFDAGYAWTGDSPYSDNNTFFQKTIIKNPIKITIEDKIEPLVYGFGTGVRTKLFGYFVRADYAWGVENGIILKPLFYLSFSLDF